MKNLPRPGIALALLLGLATLAPASRGADLADVDAYWAEVSRTVAEGDFDGYAATYHEDAVLVSQRSGQSVPIAHALAGWRQGFDDTKAGRARASVEFRFSRRLVGATTAHLTGIFHYRFQAEGGQPEDSYIHFESLLVKKPAGWKALMEYQKEAATVDQWNAAVPVLP